MNSGSFDDIPLVDPQAFARLNRWGGPGLIHEMTALFRAEVPARLMAAREATRDRQCEGAERAAHSLKSSCAQLGAVRMRALAEQAEVLSGQGTLDPVGPLLDRLEEEFVSWLDRNDMTQDQR